MKLYQALKVEVQVQLEANSNGQVWLLLNDLTDAKEKLCKIESTGVIHKLNRTNRTIFNNDRQPLQEEYQQDKTQNIDGESKDQISVESKSGKNKTNNSIPNSAHVIPYCV